AWCCCGPVPAPATAGERPSRSGSSRRWTYTPSCSRSSASRSSRDTNPVCGTWSSRMPDSSAYRPRLRKADAVRARKYDAMLGTRGYVVAQHPDKKALRRRKNAWQILSAKERRKRVTDNDQEADNDQTAFLRNEFCARLSAVRKESREQRSDEGGSRRNNPLAHRAYGEKPAKSHGRGN